MSDYEAIEDLKILSEAKNYNEWIWSLIYPFVGQRILDIGAGIGTFTEFFQDREQVTILEINDNCIKHLREKFVDKPNVQIVKHDVGKQENNGFLKSQKFDTIVALSVLEHIKNDDLALKNFRDILDPLWGNIILQLPAFHKLYGTLDEHYEHFRRYTRQEVIEKMSRAGLKIRYLIYFNSLGLFSWFFVGRLLRARKLNRAMVGFYDKIVVPILKNTEWIFRPSFGQCFLVVGEKQCTRKVLGRDTND